MSTPRIPVSLLIGASLLLAPLQAPAQQAPAPADFSGLWRIDDQASDNLAQVTASLRMELRREQSPTVAPAGSSSSGTTPQSGNRGGRHGGGMGGGHMGGGGMGGGHGRGGRRAGASSGDASSGSDDLLHPPPMLDNDAVLVVQQDAQALQARLENGEQLAVRLDGNHQQTLNGSAVARREAGGGDLQFSLQFDDGSRIDETWSRSADGRTLQVTERWQPGFLQRPVVFRRVYQRVD
ncbi:hypothetical protein [Rhodanobacter geophilus]|uniref:Secreted protein n=1 Tax=Rhodanobacter geophilus TaxID=3162488 RepID=A0ABV3QL84_9GAMM